MAEKPEGMKIFAPHIYRRQSTKLFLSDGQHKSGPIWRLFPVCFAVLACLTAVFGIGAGTASASGNVTGWAWGATSTGWSVFDCNAEGFQDCDPDFGVNIDARGNFSCLPG